MRRGGSLFLLLLMLLFLPGLACGMGFALVAGDALDRDINTVAVGVRDLMHYVGLMLLLVGIAAVLAALGWSVHRLVDTFYGMEDRLVDPRTGMGVIVRKQGPRKFIAFVPHRTPGPVLHVEGDNAFAPPVTDDRDLLHLSVEQGGHVDAVRAAAGGRPASTQVFMPPTSAPPPPTEPRIVDAVDIEDAPIVRPSIVPGDEEEVL